MNYNRLIQIKYFSKHMNWNFYTDICDHCTKFVYMTFITIDEHLIVDMVLNGGHRYSQVTEEIVWVEPF